jgi:hypothetical protein
MPLRRHVGANDPDGIAIWPIARLAFAGPLTRRWRRPGSKPFQD